MRGLVPKDLRRLFNRVRHQVTIEVLATRVRETVAVDVTPQLEQIDVPVLYLEANKDHVIPRACVRKILQHRPEAEVRTLNAPHWILQTCGDQAIAAMRPFVERCLQSQRTLEVCG